MNKCTSILISALLIVSVTGCASHKKQERKAETPMPKAETQAPAKMKVAVIETAKGNITFKFFPDDAPKTVENFVNLTNQGFYNGLAFHRVVKTPVPFVIQGGDPKGDGTGGPGYTIPAEFNPRPHLEGTVAMARTEDPNSAGSQFYICLAPQPALDGKYTVFGQVIEGLENIHKINAGDKILSVKIQEREIIKK